MQNDITASFISMWDKDGLTVQVTVEDAVKDDNDAVAVYVDSANSGKDDITPVTVTVKRSEAAEVENGYQATIKVPLSGLSVAKVIGMDVVVTNGDKTAAFNDLTGKQGTSSKYYAKVTMKPGVEKAAYGTVTVDGDKDAVWDNAGTIPITINLGSNVSANAKLLWDKDNFYVYAEIKDPVLNNTNGDAWEQDSLEVFIDENNGKSNSYEDDDKQYRISYANDHSFNGKKCLYDSIQSKTNRRAVPRMLYRMLFVKPVLDTTMNGRVLDESRLLEPYAGKTVGDITIERMMPFDSCGNWFERAGNKTHMLTRERVIRRDLLFKPGDKFDPQLVVRNKQLLRSRPYISDTEVIVVPDSLDSTRVNMVIRTRDSWTISVDAGIHGEGRTMVGLSDANIFGTGNTLKFKTNFSRRDFSYGGNIVEYKIPNVLGTFYTADFSAGRDFYNSELNLGLRKEFIRPTDYEIGLTYSDIKSKRYMVDLDTSLLVKVRNLDVWGGKSHYIRSIKSSVFLTGRYSYARFSRRPPVTADYNPALHDHDAMLFGGGLYREKFYTANMVYGFGTREYLATGYKAELVSGYSWGEFNDEMYLGMSYQTGGFRGMGYIMGGFTLGSYIDLKSGMWRHSAVDVDLKWFSNLFLFRRSRIRQFLAFNYTQGWNRGEGSDEMIRFTHDNGLQALKEYVTGTNRMILNTETVVFTPYQPLGFRIAVFGFADFGLIGYSPNIFKNDFFTSFGVGVRLRNERLVFNTVQIRLGIAFGKRGLVESEYFRLSNATRVEQYRYRPTRPEIVGFK